MATKAHCAYCFEVLVASFESRQPLSLSQVEDLWTAQNGHEEEEDTPDTNDEDNELESSTSRVPAISRLLDSDTPASNSSSSSLTSSTQPSTSSSSTSLSSRSAISPSDSYPLFVTWNTISPRNTHQKTLRGCIGTFKPLPLEHGLADYALTSAFEDTRFPPIPASQLSQLQCCVTLLTNFSNPTKDVMAWEVGKHGIKISFKFQGRNLGATYLPDVAKEQGWTREEALISLMRKAGWSGRKDEWRKVAAAMELITYEGKKVDLGYAEFKEWRDRVGK
ncbi:hypothetical protein AUEXF2481DRAFT_43418 [Aureobasidium subglaciale EXF-2481]|uniref:AMMECR1 domain-containing protein n=1 Tax=Aureobasidium subglaciale (strain EXF-2481) TaxID=1043005 RepID=A0A074YD05_AURSE|nr:uncharacterized protein AUEXF2481DRAFT_43418 [Aureobasidium subglaciale EXF-2481]KAI5207323.1 hypothetical protein E4T38_03434 [Aureobasidium subglaciale]KAI5226256.1 hypothetical protein E4T40_03187 [Aureobasidium subglaciale]KAI5229580.1 hypothetical protein E4T41_03431 [Aureobasidium subglaciale]KAI5264209.1 hypothetical protein E4T46_03208 [Aureobasidium subglaciale]KEQ92017.1 hypothetical protein AUEXF2481DRAFT_43418 [Aureobasidium subglaciale EXF-2481]